MSRDSKDDFIRKSRAVHGDRYNYSKVEYLGSRVKVIVICPVHGEFLVRPDIHIGGSICKKCQFEKKKKVLFDIGVNDLLFESHTQAYKIWKHLLMRCYDKKFQGKHRSYMDCQMSDDWLKFSSFKYWFDSHYVEGWDIDKDVILKGNKLYSASTCCFLPHEINGTLAKSDKKRGECPIGVTKHGHGYRAYCVENGVRINLGTFKDKNTAFLAYKNEKERYLKILADKYKNMLEPRAYEALCNYKVEVTD